MNTAAETVVYVHGIGQHHAGYSDPWFEAMSPHLTSQPERREVLWSDLVNAQVRAVAMSAMASSSEFLRMKSGIECVLRDRMMQVEHDEEITSLRTSAAAAAFGSGISIDDFLVYMFNPFVRSQILQRFNAIVQPLLDSGTTIQIISHSWGTVVAYEGLRCLEAEMLTGRVANLFTVGSALSISPVQSNLFQRVSDGRRPEMVDRWTNLDAAFDIVGGRLGNVFDINPPEHLGLEPVGCDSFFGIYDPRCTHSSYFDAANDAVNRDIFGRFINENSAGSIPASSVKKVRKR